MRKINQIGLMLLLCANLTTIAHAQSSGSTVVATCGTLATTYTPGEFQRDTQNTAGQKCTSTTAAAGSATSANQTNTQAAPGSDATTATAVQGVTGGKAIKTDGSAVTQPVSIASMPTTPVTGTFFQATQPVSGTVTANAGSGTQAVSLASVPSHAVTSIDGAFVNLGALADSAWSSGNGSITAILKAIDRDTLLPLAAGTANIGSITNVTGTVSLPTGAATSANQSTEITSLSSIATNTTQVASALPVGGLNAAGATATGNPVGIGGVVSTSAPSAGTTGQRKDIWMGQYGQIMVGGNPNTAGDGQTNNLTYLLSNTGALSPIPTASFSFNGTNWDRQRSNMDSGAIITASAVSATQTSADQVNYNARGVIVSVNITAISGTAPTLTCSVRGKDTASSTYYTLLTGTAMASTGFATLTVYPGTTVSANTSASMPLPRTWGVQCVVGGTGPSVTFTASASVIN